MSPGKRERWIQKMVDSPKRFVKESTNLFYGRLRQQNRGKKRKLQQVRGTNL